MADLTTHIDRVRFLEDGYAYPEDPDAQALRRHFGAKDWDAFVAHVRDRHAT